MRPSGYHVQLVVPTRGRVCWQTAARLEQIRASRVSTPPVMYVQGEHNVAWTRNMAFARFLETDAEILVFVDDDVVPPEDLLDRVTPVPDGFGMVGVPYPVTHPVAGALGFCVYEEDTSPDARGFRWTDMEAGLHECDGVGMGCVAIPRGIVEEDPAPFRFDPVPGRQVFGEDLLFCKQLRERGWKVGYWFDGGWADHIKTVSTERVFMGFQARVAEEQPRGDTVAA